MRNIEIANYNSKYDHSFYELNKSWIREFWMLKDYDKQDLLKPQKTNVDLSEEVFFAILNNIALGDAAIII